MTATDPRVVPAEAAARVPSLVGVVWALLVVNVLGIAGFETIVAIPGSVLQLVTMGSVVVAFALALLLNPRVQCRPSLYLVILSLVLVVGIASSLRLESGYGSLVRCFRFAVFVATLWLLSRWWRGDLTFVRHHLRVVSVVLLSVLAGLVVAPGTARAEIYDGRLAGVVWPITPTQVGQYGAVAAGLAILLWLTRELDRRTTLIIVPAAVVILLMTHTRTATIGFLVGIAGAGLTLVSTSSRARRGAVGAVIGAVVAVVGFLPALQEWYARDQDPELIGNLTGRQKVWDGLLAEERTRYQELLGIGLTDKSYDGLPIDSAWLAVYWEQGLVGVVLVAIALVGLLTAAALQPPSPARACAVFLILYCAVAAYTEVGLGDASQYLLHLAVAASLLVPGTGRDAHVGTSQRAAP